MCVPENYTCKIFNMNHMVLSWVDRKPCKNPWHLEIHHAISQLSKVTFERWHSMCQITISWWLVFHVNHSQPWVHSKAFKMNKAEGWGVKRSLVLTVIYKMFPLGFFVACCCYHCWVQPPAHRRLWNRWTGMCCSKIDLQFPFWGSAIMIRKNAYVPHASWSCSLLAFRKAFWRNSSCFAAPPTWIFLAGECARAASQ